ILARASRQLTHLVPGDLFAAFSLGRQRQIMNALPEMRGWRATVRFAKIGDSLKDYFLVDRACAVGRLTSKKEALLCRMNRFPPIRRRLALRRTATGTASSPSILKTS